MDNSLAIINTLTPATGRHAIDFVNFVRTNWGWPLIVTSGLRSIDQQRVLLAQGRTTTLNSKHLTGHAFDVDFAGWNRDAVPAWVWDKLGPLGEQFGLNWGGRWVSFRDVGHFES